MFLECILFIIFSIFIVCFLLVKSSLYTSTDLAESVLVVCMDYVSHTFPWHLCTQISNYKMYLHCKRPRSNSNKHIYF